MPESSSNYTQRPIERGDIDCCMDLWTTRMATGYADRLALTNAAEDVRGYTAMVAQADDELVGFAIGYAGVSARSISVPFDTAEPHCGLAPTQSVGYLAAVCVQKSWEGQGAGTALARATVEDLTNQQSPITAEAWHREAVDGRDILSKLGFEQRLSLEEYWSYATDQYGACPECGQAPCRCSGSLHILD